jgi:UDP-N-acetylmuramyl pentapeptide synthase
VSALWTSGEVAQALGAVIAAPFEANGVTFDSRAVSKGDLFFALKGETTDGHGFVAEAMKRGAAAAVVSRDVENAGGTLIRVPDTLKALEGLGRAARRRSKARIASVTGSVGKTSTKDALRAMLSAQAPTSASAASFNNHVGVPISLARLPREARYGVFEIGMNHPGEIEPLARQVKAHVGVVTNVGPAHIGFMGSEEAIADEKACLFAGMAQGAVAVLNRDVEQAAASFAGITASPGRGARRFLKFGTGTVELLDESYNGNPMSVRAMLAILARTEPAKGGRRLLALGDMRELGEGADAYHAGLADAVSASGAAQVFLCGPHMEALWRKLEPAQRGVHRPDSMALAGEVAAALRAGDVIAVKGSLGSKMKIVVDAILAASGGEAGR